MSKLQTNFKDDILSEKMDGKRRVRLTPLSDGTYIVEDVTEYIQIGSEYGQKEINQLNTTVNSKLDSEKVIDDLKTAIAVTEEGIPAGCKAISALNNNLGNCIFSVQSDGAYITYTPEGGADAVTKKLGSGIPELVQFPYIAENDGVAVGFCICFAKTNCYPEQTSTIAIRDVTTGTDHIVSTSSTQGNITINIVPGYDTFSIQKGHKYDLINIQNPPYKKYGALYILV